LGVGASEAEGSENYMSGPILTAEELAARWQVRKSWVYAQARAGTLPTLPLPGKYVRFHIAAIEDFERGRWERP
jgi:predicted DNA-binding transcriptional regulator AlpA